MIDHILFGLELLLLILIWLDGRTMRDSALRSEKLYEEWFGERRAERTQRQAAAAKARETKAAKAAGTQGEANVVNSSGSDATVSGSAEGNPRT